MGGRLCTAGELEQEEGDPRACGYDSIFKWSWVSTPTESCADVILQDAFNSTSYLVVARRDVGCDSDDVQIGLFETLEGCADECTGISAACW